MWIVMEHMRASLDKVYPLVKSKGQHMPEEVLGVIAVSVLEGLSHLYHSEKHIMHRGACASVFLFVCLSLSVRRRQAVKHFVGV